jgi:hypothetical protein
MSTFRPFTEIHELYGMLFGNQSEFSSINKGGVNEAKIIR